MGVQTHGMRRPEWHANVEPWPLPSSFDPPCRLSEPAAEHTPPQGASNPRFELQLSGPEHPAAHMSRKTTTRSSSSKQQSSTSGGGNGPGNKRMFSRLKQNGVSLHRTLAILVPWTNKSDVRFFSLIIFLATSYLVSLKSRSSCSLRRR